jgi:hypothetical protein
MLWPEVPSSLFVNFVVGIDDLVAMAAGFISLECLYVELGS